jgi:electron transport complex protein RnfA
VLGVAVMNVSFGYGFVKSVLFSTAAAVGFSFALVIFTGLREKIDRAAPPRAFRGVAIALVTAGLLSLAFMGFGGLVK